MKQTVNSKPRWAACLLGLATVLTAQQPPGADVRGKKFYEELIATPIVPLRAPKDIQEDLKATDNGMVQADKAIAGAQARIKESEGWLAALKGEMDGLKGKANIAKKEKREADKLTLEAQLKQLELVEEYLKKTKSIRDAELDFGRARKEQAGAERKVYEAESGLNSKVAAIKSAGPQAANLSKLVVEGAEAGEKVLKLIKEMADKNEDAAGRMKQLAERRIELAQARNKLLSEDRIRGVAAGMKK